MAKLTKPQLAAHRAAVALLESGQPLTLNQCQQVLDDWHEGAGGDQTASSAYFTPSDMASDLRFDTPSYGALVDLCAGTGRLAFYAGGQCAWEPRQYSRLVCVERNPAYVAIGRRVLPHAEWICGDALDPAVIRQIGTVDAAILNPPFGTTTRSDFAAPRYSGGQLDLALCDLASTLAPHCWAILPQSRARWDYRGDWQKSKWADQFQAATGLDFWRFSNVDPQYYRDQWRSTAPAVEVVGFGEEFEAEQASTTIIFNRPAAPAAPAPAPAIAPAPAPVPAFIAAAPVRPAQLALF